MRHLTSGQYWDRPAGGDTGHLFLDTVLTYKDLIYLSNLQFIIAYETLKSLIIMGM